MHEIRTRAHVLSNGRLSTLVTTAGGGFSALDGFALTPWQPDPVVEAAGTACYIRDAADGAFWSAAHFPCAPFETSGRTVAHADRVVLDAQYQDIAATSEIFVAADVDAEVRRVRIGNRGRERRALTVTTFAELCLNTLTAFTAHPAFSRLFVQTDYDVARRALIAWRRPRSPDDRPLWVAQRLTGVHDVEFETDRARFLGRTRSRRDPIALVLDQRLSGTTGTVLDPAFCLRAPLELAPEESVHLELVTCAADSHERLLRILDEWREPTRATAPADAAVTALGLPERWREHIDIGPFEHEWYGSAPPPAPVRPAQGGTGAFSDDGTEYQLGVGPEHAPTPQPWVNVLANEGFGCIISETGAGCVWAANSRENRITPWSNDAAADPHADALFVLDRETGEFWSVLPGPSPYEIEQHVRHGFGYSSFESAPADLELTACVFVPRSDPVRITQLRLVNQTDRPRRLALVSYAQLVLGATPADTRGRVVTTYDAHRHVLRASNRERGEYSQRVTFATAVTDGTVDDRSATGSRREFLGEQGDLVVPAGLIADRLEGRFGSSFDACAALRMDVTLAPHGRIDCAFLLGEGDDDDAAAACLARYPDTAAVAAARSATEDHWRELLGAVQIRTPSRPLDLMLNGWLAYQNLACRMLARSAFYQSGGAFGYRDQLQDAAALLYLDPAITRAQILLHAAHQFVEGDVLHWWHPPAGKGIRTRFSDDLLWLPYITLFYIDATGDDALLDERTRFLTAEVLHAPEEEIFVRPDVAGEDGSLYEHCCRALDRSLTAGAHGLPLMSVGDWNDGMNRVGREGRGESVWLGFFLFDILHRFIPLCEQRGDDARVERYGAYLRDLGDALHDAGWDGAWYRRAYYDDGTPLGSAQNDECRIDALAQAWAVLSRAAPADRAEQALAALKQHLVDERSGIIRLLTPAFDNTPHDPGYIKGYVPGVRENGGQYTHAAAWAVRALAEHGDRETAARLLELLTPVHHTRSAAQVAIYQGEPYVVAADVYGVAPHVGRAGWTWYTGSAGWLYRVMLESILGFTLDAGRRVRLCPCIPADWPGFSVRYRTPNGTGYTFTIEQHDAGTTTSAGCVEDRVVVIPLEDDGGEHEVTIRLGRDVGPAYQQRLQPIAAP